MTLDRVQPQGRQLRFQLEMGLPQRLEAGVEEGQILRPTEVDAGAEPRRVSPRTSATSYGKAFDLLALQAVRVVDTMADQMVANKQLFRQPKEKSFAASKDASASLELIYPRY